MHQFDEFAKGYLCLGLRINKHIEGYVEHYYGPVNLKILIDGEDKTSPKKLLDDCKELINKLPDQGFDDKRKNFLRKNLNSIEIIIRKLDGEKLPYLELVEGLFDFKPVLYEDKFFYELTENAERIYLGNGSLSERIMNYAKRRTIPRKLITNLYNKAFKIAQKNTNKIFNNLLPVGENYILKEVENEGWSMYCWYQGNYFSNIEINIDQIHYWSHLLYDACHEGYPGHHMERALKEYYLFRSKGYFECSILFIYTPEMVISEGIGLLAESVIFDREESAKILLEDLYPFSNKEDELDILIQQIEIREGFKKFQGNLSYYKHVFGWTDSELTKYAKSFKVITDAGIKSTINMISDDTWAPYMLCYQGERLIRENYGNRPSTEKFQKLLLEQNLPSTL